MSMQTTPLIRQGWLRVVIYFVGLFLLMLGVPLLAMPLVEQLTSDKEFSFTLLYIIIAIFVIGFTWVMKKFVDRQPFITLGFRWKNFEPEAWIGFFTALAMLGIGTLILVLQKQVSFIGYSFDIPWLLSQLVLMVVVAFVEEISFRGYMLNNLVSSVNKWLALVIVALLFAGVHITNPGVTALPIINVFLAGLLLGSNYIFSRNLWFAIFFHFAWNFTQGPILGYQVSGMQMKGVLKQFSSGDALLTGGEFGFEGSLICTMLLFIFTIVWLFLFHRKYNDTPPALAE